MKSFTYNNRKRTPGLTRPRKPLREGLQLGRRGSLHDTARHRLQQSISDFLEEVARRGSWLGGGSTAALSAATAAALLEKLIVRKATARALRRIRYDCVGLIERDARAFAGVVQAIRQDDRRVFRRSLMKATDVPWRVFRHAARLQATCREAQRTTAPRLQSDLRCAMALALASGESARTLIHTNLAWLNDKRYSQSMRRRLQATSRPRPRAT